MDSILDTHAPLKKVNKYKLKFKTKPWITPALQKSISIKNKLLKKFITVKDPQIKERYHKENKDYRNLLSTILKESETNYFNHYFESNWNSIKNTWKGIKSIITIKESSADISKSLSVDGVSISNPLAISNILKNYYLQLLVRRSLIFHFHINVCLIFLKIDLIFPFFISPTGKSEIENIICSLLTNQKWHFVNQHPTYQQTSHIPHPEHPTSCTSHIPNIPHPEHPTS